MTNERPDAVLYRKLRAETISLLNFDAANLSVAESTKVDLVSSLRLALDHFTALQLRGEQVDVGKLLSASEALERLLPRSASPTFNAKARLDDVRRKFHELIEQHAEHIEHERDRKIAALTAEVGELKAVIGDKDAVISALTAGAAPSPPAPSPPTASPSPSPPPASPPRSSQPPLRVSTEPYLQRGGGSDVRGYDRWSNRN